MPITDNRKGKNKYYIRLNVDIPTDANFPVYDVNIKLPKEIAQNAAASQWYDEILLNKKPLKNEGRFYHLRAERGERLRMPDHAGADEQGPEQHS